ncbi:MAG TPA: DNA replication and repair protein RecF [Saprospiraceae bacterium]|nr:DNA replication and repair protein RecF [Saprospiraceae bacterium]
MYLQSIRLTQFKNYGQRKFDFNARFNVVTGHNGVGKTNLLDAIYVLCMTKSFFGGTDRNIIRKETDFARLAGIFRMEGGMKQMDVVAKVIKQKKKTFEVNGKVYDRLLEHVGRLPVVMIAPDDTLIATGGSEERRKFADNTLSQKNPAYLSALVRYNRLLKQRNALLKSKSGWLDMNLLQSYNDQLLEPAEYIFSARKAWTDALTPLFNEYYSLISGAREEVSIAYKSPLSQDAFSVLLDKSLEKDKILERTTVGIHRDDFVFFMEEMPLKRFASQGQRKSFVIALKLAQYQFLAQASPELPILLMDDIFDKLDRERVANLVEVIGESGFGQVFITDTHPTRVSELLDIPHQVIDID